MGTRQAMASRLKEKARTRTRRRPRSPSISPRAQARLLLIQPSSQVRLLVYTGTKKFAYFKMLVPARNEPNSPKTTLCMNYLLQGCTCKYSDECDYKHVNKYTELPEPVQAKFLEYVKDTEDLDFAKDKGPPPGTS